MLLHLYMYSKPHPEPGHGAPPTFCHALGLQPLATQGSRKTEIHFYFYMLVPDKGLNTLLYSFPTALVCL